MSGSRIIIAEEDRLDNIHPGEILREDFMVGIEIAVEDIVTGAGIDCDRLQAILAGQAPIDAEIAIRLARYFGMSEGFFLGLQNDYDLEEAHRANGADLDRIVRRAA